IPKSRRSCELRGYEVASGTFACLRDALADLPVARKGPILRVGHQRSFAQRRWRKGAVRPPQADAVLQLRTCLVVALGATLSCSRVTFWRCLQLSKRHRGLPLASYLHSK